MRMLSNLFVALILALGTPVAVCSPETGNGCPPQATVDGDAGNPCNPSDNGNGVACGVIASACQVSAVLVAGTAASAASPVATHFLPSSPHYLSPDLFGLFRPPIAHVS